MATLRERLLERQTTAELERKADIARRRQNIWTQEEIEAAERVAVEMVARLKWKT